MHIYSKIELGNKYVLSTKSKWLRSLITYNQHLISRDYNTKNYPVVVYISINNVSVL